MEFESGQRDVLRAVGLACPGCERNAQGVCRDCPAPLPSRNHRRCAACGLVHRRRQSREARAARYQDPVERRRMLATNRRSYHKPEIHVRRLAYAESYDAAHPRQRDDLDRLYHRVNMRDWRAKHRTVKHGT